MLTSNNQSAKTTFQLADTTGSTLIKPVVSRFVVKIYRSANLKT